MKQIIINIIKCLGTLCSYIHPEEINKCIHTLKNNPYTGYVQNKFAYLGKYIIMWSPYALLGTQDIHISNNVVIESGVQLATHCASNYINQKFVSEIIHLLGITHICCCYDYSSISNSSRKSH